MQDLKPKYFRLISTFSALFTTLSKLLKNQLKMSKIERKLSIF